MSNQPHFPRNESPAKPILVARRARASLTSMLDDAYATVANQLSLFKRESVAEAFDAKKATAFNKIVTSLTTLDASEQRQEQRAKLGDLSDAELEALVAQATHLLPKHTDSDPNESD